MSLITGVIALLSFATEVVKYLREKNKQEGCAKGQTRSDIKDFAVALKTARQKGDASELEAMFSKFGFVRKPNDKLQDNGSAE